MILTPYSATIESRDPICIGCDYRISPESDWKFSVTQIGRKLHRACEEPKR